MSFDERPNVKVGVTNTVHSRLRDLKKKGDNFNDVIERLLDIQLISAGINPDVSTKLKPKI